MSRENQWLEDVFPIEIVPFWGDIGFPGCRFDSYVIYDVLFCNFHLQALLNFHMETVSPFCACTSG